MFPLTRVRSNRLFEALSLLTPFDTATLQKIRIGPNFDGGYVMFDDFEEISLMYSFGIGSNITFECQLAERGKKIYMFDHTISNLPFEHANFNFYRLGASGHDNAAGNVFTIATHIEMLGHSGRSDMALKIDIEGDEFETISRTPADVLRQFRQLVLEVHFLSRLSEPEFLDKFVRTFTHLNSVFTLCHVHGNNNTPLSHVEGHPIVDALELTYVRSDLITAEPSRTIYPTIHDHACRAWVSDVLLWFYPFLPASLSGSANASADAFRQSLQYGDQTLRHFGCIEVE